MAEDEEAEEDATEGEKEDEEDVAGRARRLPESGPGTSLVLGPDRLSPNAHRGHSSDIRRQRSYSPTPMTAKPPPHSIKRSTDRQRLCSRTSGPSLVSSPTLDTEPKPATKPKSGGLRLRSHSPRIKF